MSESQGGEGRNVMILGSPFHKPKQSLKNLNSNRAAQLKIWRAQMGQNSPSHHHLKRAKHLYAKSLVSQREGTRVETWTVQLTNHLAVVYTPSLHTFYRSDSESFNLFRHMRLNFNKKKKKKVHFFKQGMRSFVASTVADQSQSQQLA